MADFKDLVSKYSKKQSTTLIDSIAVGLSMADEVSVDLGLLSDSGLLDEVLNALSTAVPFVIITVTEGSRVLLGRKTATAGMQDGGYRIVKSGVAMGAGAIVAGLGAGFLPAIPVSIGIRILMDKFRSQSLTGYRVDQRIKRLRALHEFSSAAQDHGIWQALPEGKVSAQ